MREDLKNVDFLSYHPLFPFAFVIVVLFLLNIVFESFFVFLIVIAFFFSIALIPFVFIFALFIVFVFILSAFIESKVLTSSFNIDITYLLFERSKILLLLNDFIKTRLRFSLYFLIDLNFYLSEFIIFLLEVELDLDTKSINRFISMILISITTLN